MSDIESKLVTVPNESEMWNRLLAVVGNESLAAGLFEHLRPKAGIERTGNGVMLMVGLAIADYSKGLPPPIGNLLQHFIQPLAEAYIDDAEVKAYVAHEFEAIGAQQAGAKAASAHNPPRPELSDNNKLTLMSHIKRLASIYDEYIDDTAKDSAGAHRKGGANPFHHQTLNGLYLAFYYSTPTDLWTPWGTWQFGGAQSYQMDVDGFMSRLTLRPYIEGSSSETGYISPVYAILAIDDETLPEPVLPADNRQHLDYDTAEAEWERFYGAG